MINLSYSAAQKYLSSPFSYFAHYFLRLRPEKTGSALIFGSALDEGFNSLLEDKRDGKEPSLEKAIAAFDASFGKHKTAQIKYSKADFDEHLIEDDELMHLDAQSGPWTSLSRKGHILIDEYNKQVMPRLEKVILVQHRIDVKNSVGDAFTGIIDLVAQIDGKVYVIDNKSTSKPYTATSANESPQLATYFEAVREECGAHGVAYITVPKNLRKKKLPVVDISIIFGETSEELINKTYTEYDEALTGIRQGKFPCTPEKCCAAFWGCDYKRYCESGGTDMTGLVVADKSSR